MPNLHVRDILSWLFICHSWNRQIVFFPENSKVLQQILQNPHLQELLVSVDRSPNPDRTMQLAMQEPLFVEFADECLKIIEPVEDASTVPT